MLARYPRFPLYRGFHRPQQRNRGKLAALVDAHGQRVLLGRVDFNPAATFGDHPTTGQFAI